MPADWRTRAACRGDNANVDIDWWDTASDLADQRKARAWCLSCPVLGHCARETLTQPPAGVIKAGFAWTIQSKPALVR